ncbi:MAG: Lead, cadmium, zinc and mercury transporting ATPase (EC (EC; Copper-translocating P-type ATPase (EC [uncultured Sulfurovum sp.]|uniref:Lead, cadmium, zinc and mercury transporting ATPase )) n=1 Tax=uncultured Sulfurovum sp. TaxID=269237 RepID=A0A6S6TGM2_9BACT|nr:MAG: Lead, cadmium, zinc and mercury transporting ATPase (EC (EC; Copper-translocating P-type ATPase (EC [uncultured Sulfurovum sp.]
MSQVACTHCNLTFSEEVMIKDNGHFFCCKGCQGVYTLLNNEGLDSFYDKLGNRQLHPVTEVQVDLEKFDLEGFKNKYIKTNEEGLYEVNLVIEGIHCSACVWLNEKVLHQTDGVMDASINYTNNKAKIVWDPLEIKLSKIIETIQAIGYNAFAYDPSLQEEQANKIRKSYYTRILVAVFGAMNIMWLAVAHYAGYFSGIQQSFKDILNVAEFILATPVLFYSGWIFFRGAYYGYKNKIVNMDTLVASGALSAYIYSIYAMVTQQGEVYFDSVVMIITFVLVGKYLEILSKKHAVDTLDSMMSSVPTEVSVLNNGVKSLVAVENVMVDDTIELKPGEKVVIDGIVSLGEGSFDESSLTGENEPIYKKKGYEIRSGSICLDSVILYKTSTDASNSLLSSIVNLLEDAMTKKPRIEQLANSISGYFSTTILVIALLTFIGWYFYTQSFEHALIIGISVIVIACPCALGLATPMATLVGIGEAAKRGILFKEATFLETMAKSNLLALDKTGTITEGKPSVVKYEINEAFDPSLLLALVSTSNHPISKGIISHLEAHYDNLTHLNLEHIKSIEARGLEATYEGKKLLGGNASLLHEKGIEVESDSHNALFFFVQEHQCVARFELTDTIREGTKEAIEEIRKLGIDVVMLTGDHLESAHKVAKEVGIDEVHAKLLPHEKSAKIAHYQQKGKRVVMVGDGINDAIALSSAEIAIAMGNGADIAIGVSDVILLDEKPRSIYEAYKTSQRTYQAVKENLGFSLLYNVVAVPLAVLGFVNPLVAALSMSLSSLVVVGNSMRIKRLKFKKEK